MDTSHDTDTTRFLKGLRGLARRGIVAHYNPFSFSFDHILTDDRKIMEKKPLLLTHSLIAFIGVSAHRPDIDLDYETCVERLIPRVFNVKNSLREVSLLLWLLAKDRDPRAQKTFGHLEKVYKRLNARAETMELAWALTGACFEYLRNAEGPVHTTIIHWTQTLLRRFQPKIGLFLHRERKQTPLDVRYNIANFADQIYSIYALSLVARATKDEGSLKTAVRCADTLIRLQGGLGQWWWHYDALTGKVVQKYPVFSVHQDSMAVFALMSLSAVAKKDYRRPITRGLRWLLGDNELKEEMINREKFFVRRGIKRRGRLSKAAQIRTLFSNYSLMKPLHERYDEPPHLEVMDWEHSYHLGWILYTFSDENQHLWSQL